MKKIKFQPMSSASTNLPFLLKYCPKYLHKLHFSSSSLQKWKIHLKFRSLKIVKSLDIRDYTIFFRDLIISSFKSQKNCLKDLRIQDLALVKYYPRLQRFSLCSKRLESWKMFLRLNHLKTLTIECPYIKNPADSIFVKGMGKIKDFYWRFWGHFARLRFLKDFNVNLYHKLDPEVLHFLRKLDNLKDGLGSFRGFSLFLNHLDVDPETDLDFVNIYKHLTCLRIHESSFTTTQKFLSHLRHFKKLESLNILKNITDFEEDTQFVDFSYFSKLEALDRIEEMEIAMNFCSGENLLNFLEHFTIPESVVSLKLSFYETDWARLFPSNQLENLKMFNVFESHAACVNFYEKWRNLRKLESLALYFCEGSSSMIPSLYFATPIFRNLVNLKELYFGNWANNFSNSPNISEKTKALNLYYLWEALKHVKPSLRKLYIDSSAITLKGFPVELKEEEKLSLEELGFCGLILGDLYIETLSKIFNKKLAEEKENCSKLEIESVIVDNKNSMQQLIELLMTLSKRIQVSVTIDLRNISSEDFLIIAMKTLQKLMDSKSRIKIDFSRIPELPPLELRNFKKLFKEYKASIPISSHTNLVVSKQRNQIGNYPSPEELFEDFEEDEREVISFGDEEEEWESEDDSSESMDEIDELLEDFLEEIDEDI